MWIASISPKSLNLGVKSRCEASQLWPHPWLEHWLWWPLAISEPIFQSQPCTTIHHTNDERLEGSRCCETIESIQTYSILVWSIRTPEAETAHHLDSKVRVCWWLYMMNWHIHLGRPFIIPIMRYWKGQAGVNCLNQSKVTQCWCETWVYAKPNLYPRPWLKTRLWWPF